MLVVAANYARAPGYLLKGTLWIATAEFLARPCAIDLRRECPTLWRYKRDLVSSEQRDSLHRALCHFSPGALTSAKPVLRRGPVDPSVVDLAAEISALPPDHPAAPRAHLALAAARLGEVDFAVLTEIGQHPAMCARDVVEALRRPDVNYRNAYKDLQPRLGVLLVPFAGNGSARSVSVSRSHHARCSVPNMRRNFQLAVLAYGLVRERAFVRESDAVNRYVLTTRGLRLLAAHAMLAIADYQELYAIVADDGGPEQPALDFAYMFGAHTSGITAVFLSVRDAARARPGRLEWRGEWACIKTTRLGQLRPDAEFVYREADWWSRWFLEYERGHPSDEEIDAKLEKYDDLQNQYPDNSVRRADNTTYDARRGFTVLWVCERAHPAERILARYEAMSKPGWHSRLRVLVTTLQDLADQDLADGGIGRSVWRSKPGGSTTTIALGPDSRSETS